MSGRILVGCYEVPGYGGAATASYRLFENLQHDGIDVAYMNIIDVEDVEYFRYRFGECMGNPRHLENVANCELQELLFDPHPGLARMIEELDPEVMLADDYIAALLMKLAAPERRLIFMTAGMAQVIRYLDERRRRGRFTIKEFVREARGGLNIFHPRERQAMEIADLIITHSDLIRDLVLELFPDCQGKVYSRVIWRAEWIAQDAQPYTAMARPFAERDIDVMFVSSLWTRPEKNQRLLREIVSRCRDLRVHVVGEMPGRLGGAHCHGLIADREQLFELLGRSKVLVSPSQFDPAPGVLWEASVMGCNVVASRACGNWMLCHDELLAASNQSDDFAAKIRRALPAKLEDNMQFFMDTASYADLVETITMEESL
jgi:glycosyltransferase involved in cell wall biosynthesis